MINSVEAEQLVDEEVLREYTISSIKLWALKGMDNVNSIDQEIQLLSNRSKAPPTPDVATPQPRPPLKPVVITKEMLKVSWT